MKTLFGHPDSGHAYKVRLFMCVAGIPHDYEQVDIFKPRDERPAIFRKYAVYGEVPLLLDGDRCYVQSNAILLHLANETGLWGGEHAKSLNDCAQWLFWEANKIGLCLPQLRARKRFGSDDALEAAFPWLSARYTHDINVLENTLSDGRHWITGSVLPTIADFSLCGYLFFADEADVQVPKHVAAWLKRIQGLDGWQHAYQLLAT